MREQKYKERNFMEKLFVLTLKDGLVLMRSVCLLLAINHSILSGLK